MKNLRILKNIIIINQTHGRRAAWGTLATGSATTGSADNISCLDSSDSWMDGWTDRWMNV